MCISFEMTKLEMISSDIFNVCYILRYSISVCLINVGRFCVTTGEKLPWTAKLQNLTIYTTHRSEQMLYLLKPASLCATLAVTTKYHCLQTDNLTDSLSLLGLCIHADMQMVEMAVSNPQVYCCHLFSLSLIRIGF